MTTFIFANNAKSTLASGISSTATSVTLATGSGSLFPSPTSGQQFTLTLTDAATGSINEICYCTGRSSDTLTIVRGQEGTTARAWLAGDIAANKITAGTATSFSQGGSGGTASNIANGAANQIVYQTAANTTSFITAPSTSNTYLQWTGSGFTWSSSTSSGPTLSSNNAWTGTNTFTTIGPSSAGGASLGSVTNFWNTIYSTVFQCVTPGDTPTNGAAFFQYTYSGSNYGFVGGDYGQIIGYGGLGGTPNYNLVAIADVNGFYPGTTGTALGTVGLPWGTVNATNGTFSGNVTGTWTGSSIGVTKGGTGTNTTPANGQLLIGNGSSYSVANLTAGSGISISNSSGGITISSTGSGGSGVSSITAISPLLASASTGNITLSIPGGATLTASSQNWTGSNLFSGSTGSGGVATTINGGNNYVASTVFQVQNLTTQGAVFTQTSYSGGTYGLIGGINGLIVNLGTSEPGTELVVFGSASVFPYTASGLTLGTGTNPWSNVYAGTYSSGTWNGSTIGTAYGGTGVTSTPGNGQLLIGNGFGYSLANLTAGSNITITNSSGGITISSTGGGGGGVTSITASTGISASASTGAVTLTNTGVTSMSAGSGITLSGSTGSVTVSSNLTSSSNTWTSGNTFSSTIQANNGINSTVFQTSVSGVAGAAFTQYPYSGVQYAIIGGTGGLIVNTGSSEPGTELTVTNSTGLFPFTASSLTLGTSANPWSVVYASTGAFSGNVSGIWAGNTIAPSYGGTGLTSPGASGNVLTSNGSGWVSAAPSGGGVSSITASTGISASSSTGAITLTNTGVTSLSAGSGISLSGSTGSITVSSNLTSASNTWTGTNNFGSTASTSFPYTLFSQAGGSTGIAVLTYAPSGSESNWDAVIGSTSEGIAYFSVGSPASPTGIGSITYNGSSVIYGTTSDRRLKDNIEVLPAGTGAAAIQALTPRSFTWKHNNTNDVGFVADEVQAVVPNAVSGNPTDTRQDGSIKAQTIDPSLLVVYLVQAVQELMAEVAALKGKA